MNAATIAKLAPTDVPVSQLRDFIEHEAVLLDERRWEEWYQLFADDGAYWAPARHGQEHWLTHVSLFYDDKHTLKTRVTRLQHPQLHCQEPISHCVRVLSSTRLEAVEQDEHLVSSRFVMLEDRVGAPQRVFGGRVLHRLRHEGQGRLSIVQKRVELTNCDQTFPMLTQPF
ncbi:aromatic-ring-hydroxylating dioxygenase subunit beta [Hydrogenophaga sp. BPS33]|uniref:aromatic-ring-hydroxylating dioxygenase subunit beta n=1 Tax=Hydrogenophaga sp. BPS33 TaxID=2651974 RepID=UPI0013200163|nr:aromatic-ring-hydroxylating dioxygenase subunit beta [Hydrogenophaga sp. BPS33]QHE85194.1 aromatic-ring-hydroxylating dioxygenase subunit beta [Hydrogenophaga sp. BPS33]